MTKTLITFCGVALALMSSCSPSDTLKKLNTAEQLMEEQTDSAWHILCSIDTTVLRQGEERALYNLLKMQAQYKLYIPIKSDSLLDYSAEYYAQHGNNNQKANTYYYKGVILSDLGKTAKAALWLKKAEIHAQQANNELLKNKIYEALGDFNELVSNNTLALHYNKRFLKSSILLADTELICRAYDDVSVILWWTGQKDSSRYYRAKCNELLPKAKVLVNRFLADHARELISEQEYGAAKLLLLKADSITHTAFQYNMLAEIALSEGDTVRATEYWGKALRIGDYTTIIQTYKKWANVCSQRNQYQEAYYLLHKADSVTHAYNELVRPVSTAMLQQEFDLAQADLEASRQQNRWLVTMLVVVVLLSSAIIFYLAKNRKLKRVVSKNITALREAQYEVERLRHSDENHEMEISQLNTRIQSLNEEMAQRLGKGKEIYEKAMRREVLSHFTTKDEQCLIDYYAYTYAQRFTTMLLPYQDPTRRLVTYLLLRDMKLDDKDIQYVLSISKNTIRSYRHRLK